MKASDARAIAQSPSKRFVDLRIARIYSRIHDAASCGATDTVFSESAFGDPVEAREIRDRLAANGYEVTFRYGGFGSKFLVKW